ncbi:anthranilate phosphoribosyltransferase [Plantactinospora sp. KBS50]|uniref:anthranilate phosphoribosyltransferase n=1 Tax=Plantactinospora sp. KBS50 TaxID=2024580 RepID=UPI000BAB01E0|nr:anthranilate phosphoribosyltransferase [Plantactinospora sp. KBS50]ASW53769.1 anthranilate phosphoribosyltransferase [Plantactinospora sp. KBS50]
MAAFRSLIGKVAAGQVLTQQEMAQAVDLMVSGAATPAQMGALLMGLRMRGETVPEIIGAVTTMRARMRRVPVPPDAMDVVGTGGDSSGSYNISTCAAFVVAGAGVPVAKHGNRALSSRCGAADVLTELGVRIDLDPDAVAACVAEAGIGFMFAPAFHPALRQVGPTRVELGVRTIFNLLGPLLNPAGVTRHLVGVYAAEWTEPIARALGELGSQRALVVHGSDGLDEITTTGPTTVASLRDGTVTTYQISPADVGLAQVAPAALRGGDAAGNATALRAVLRGEPGPYRDVVLFNAAAALLAGGRVDDLAGGLTLAAKSVDSGQAEERLAQLVAVSNAANPST